jgi:hypothetical protein
MEAEGQSGVCPHCGHSVLLSKVPAEELPSAPQTPSIPAGTPDRLPLMAAMVPAVLFLSSLVTPALHLGADLAFGYTAFYLSFLGILLFSTMHQNNWESIFAPIACTMGAVANLSFIVGYICFLSRRRILWAFRASILSSCLSIVVLPPLFLTGNLKGLSVGYGLWVASSFALAVASWRRAGQQGEACRAAFAYAAPILLLILVTFGGLGVIGWFAQQFLRANWLAKQKAATEARIEREWPVLKKVVKTRQQCLMNLEQIQAAVESWARDHGKSKDALPRLDDLRPYFKDGILPYCPADGNHYIPVSLGGQPLCGRHGSLTPSAKREVGAAKTNAVPSGSSSAGKSPTQTVATQPLSNPIRKATPTVGVQLGDGVILYFVRIEPGTFVMGADSSALAGVPAQTEERPARSVTISKPYYLGKYEVTQRQWQSVMGNNPSRQVGPNRPVENISWDDCQSFILQLQKQLQKRNPSIRFALPTEAQWEYACRAGGTGDFTFGNEVTLLPQHAWFQANSGNLIHDVGQKLPNTWGLHDMHGNVWEWCADWWADSYEQAASADPTGPASGSWRVMRGGAMNHSPRYLRSSQRAYAVPTNTYPDIGLRLVMVFEPKKISPKQAGPPYKLEELRIKAEQNDAKAQYNLGLMYYQGNGVSKDTAKAISWWRKAADQGDGEAQHNLGVMCFHGQGVAKDAVEAAKWFSLAGERGIVSAQYNLGGMYVQGVGLERNYREGLKWLSKAANQGDREAQFYLGGMFDAGEGTSRNSSEAVIWWRKSAEQGFAEANYCIGNAYAKGEGVAKDEAAAALWWRKAAELGVREAHYNLAAAYDEGLGVGRDEALAAKHYQKAAELGYGPAQYNLGFNCYKGLGVARNYAEAIKWYRLAAQQGFAHAQYNLGGMYLEGQGVEQNIVEAHAWFTLASGEVQNAAKGRDFLARQMSPEHIFESHKRVQMLRTQIAANLARDSRFTMSLSPRAFELPR